MSQDLIDDTAEATARRRRDPELLAIQQIAWELEELSPEARRWALAWLNARFAEPK